LPYVVKGRFVRFAIPVLFASLIHKSVLLILPLYFLAKVKKTKWLYVGALLLFPVSLKFARQFTLFLADTSGSENYMNYAVSTYETNGAITFSILLVLTAICSILALKTKACQELIADAKYRILFNSVPMAIVLVPLTFVDPTLQRVGQYYSIFIIWLLPIILVSVDKSKTVWHAFFLIILLTIISHNNPYAFMWQDMQLGCNYGGQIINQTI
jgi:transmembrane protein EpsG